jgi:acyl phosphate:glycerol-3-phosphate acyltransferase
VTASVLVVALGYLAGSVPFGLLLTRAFAGADVREHGSGNIGATNVSRVAGKKVGVLVLLLDAGKGALPVLLSLKLEPGQPLLHCAVGLAAFLGHVFPVWLKFKGGKGVATAAGVLAMLLPWSALAGFVVYAALLAAFRVSSIGSLAGAIAAVVAGFVVAGPIAYPLLALGLLGAMVWTHRGNLQRLLKRTENRV